MTVGRSATLRYHPLCSVPCRLKASLVIAGGAVLAAISGTDDLEAALSAQDVHAEVVEYRLESIPFWSARQSLRVTMGPDNRIFLAHPNFDGIQVLSQEGIPLTSIPLRAPGGLALAPLSNLYVHGDSLVATSSAQSLRVVFGLDGTPLRRDSLPMLDMPTPYRAAAASRLIPGGAVGTPAISPQTMSEAGNVVPIVRGGLNGRLEGVLARVELGNTMLRLPFGSDTTLATYPAFRHFLTRSDLWSIATDGRTIAIVDRRTSDSSFSVTRISTVDADTVYRVEFDVDPIPIPTEVLEKTIATAVRESSLPWSYGEIDRAIRAAAEIPRTYPAASAVLMDEKDKIWVQRELLSTVTRRWDLLSTNGTFERSVELPADLVVRAVRGVVALCIAPVDEHTSKVVVVTVADHDDHQGTTNREGRKP